MQKPVAPVKADTPTVAKIELKPTPETKPAAGQCLAWGALDAKQLARVQGGLPALKLATAPQSSVKEEARGSGRVWVFYPPLALCTDNGAMIALAAAMRAQRGLAGAHRGGAFDVRPRWPLDQIDTPAAVR